MRPAHERSLQQQIRSGVALQSRLSNWDCGAPILHQQSQLQSHMVHSTPNPSPLTYNVPFCVQKAEPALCQLPEQNSHASQLSSGIISNPHYNSVYMSSVSYPRHHQYEQQLQLQLQRCQQQQKYEVV